MDRTPDSTFADHATLSHPAPPVTTPASTAQKQALNGAESVSGADIPCGGTHTLSGGGTHTISTADTSTTGSSLRSSLTKVDGSNYQLVFGIDTNSETSLASRDSAALVLDSSARVSSNTSKPQLDGAEIQSNRHPLSASSPCPSSVPVPSDPIPHPPSNAPPSGGSLHPPSDSLSHPPSDASPRPLLNADISPRPSSDASTHVPLDASSTLKASQPSDVSPHPSSDASPLDASHRPSDVSPRPSSVDSPFCQPSEVSSDPPLNVNLRLPSVISPRPSSDAGPGTLCNPSDGSPRLFSDTSPVANTRQPSDRPSSDSTTIECSDPTLHPPSDISPHPPSDSYPCQISEAGHHTPLDGVPRHSLDTGLHQPSDAPPSNGIPRSPTDGRRRQPSDATFLPPSDADCHLLPDTSAGSSRAVSTQEVASSATAGLGTSTSDPFGSAGPLSTCCGTADVHLKDSTLSTLYTTATSSLSTERGPVKDLPSSGARSITSPRTSQVTDSTLSLQTGEKKSHPLSILTSDSEPPTPPPGWAYSPVLNTSGETV
jgi:hypothetical protein